MEHFDPHGLIYDFALVLSVAAITTVLFRKLKQPVVLGYLLAGMIVGPYIPIPLLADTDRIQTLSELGVILVMFAIGLEFSFRKLLRVGPTAGVVAVIQICIMIWLGYLIGQAFGWTSIESIFTGAMIAISSTMIIAKAFAEQRVSGKVSELVLGILIVEDLAAILLLAMLTAFTAGSGLPADALLATAFRLCLFLVAFVFIGILVVPKVIHMILKLNSPETLLVSSIGICFASALLAQKMGYSVALGAFIAGSLVAESGHAHQVEHLVGPVRDIFAAIFFISVGMLMDPRSLLEHWQAVLVITAIVLAGKMLSVSLGAFLTGLDVRSSVKAGMSMAQIGEFSFIIVAAGLSTAAIRDFLYPVAIAVCVITTFTTPWFIQKSDVAASFLDRILPERLLTLTTLYTSWVKSLRKEKPATEKSQLRRTLIVLALDAMILIVIVIVSSVSEKKLTQMLVGMTQLQNHVAAGILIAGVCILCLPFVVWIVRSARVLGATLAAGALPRRAALDTGEAPRNALTLILELLTVLVVGLILLAATQPFLPALSGPVFLLMILSIFAFMVWRGAADLQSHFKAGAQIVAEALSNASYSEESIHDVEQLLPGLGEISSIAIGESTAAVGKTLADLDIHGQTGALVVAIRRDPEGVIVPGGKVQLRLGDVLALVGTEEAIESAKLILSANSKEPHPDQTPP